MDRESDRHGARQDAALSKSVQDVVQGGGSSRAQDWRDPEPAGEDQPRASLDPEHSVIGGTPKGIDAEDATGRSELAQAMTGLRYPASAADVQAAAQDGRVSDGIRAELRGLPQDVQYESLAQVWAALGHGIEDKRG